MPKIGHFFIIKKWIVGFAWWCKVVYNYIRVVKSGEFDN